MKKFFKILDWFFTICNSIVKIIFKYPFLLLIIIILIVLSTVILMFNKQVNVGGILGKLLKKENKIDTANSIPSNRKQALEEADKNGYAQHKISELETSLNPFRDKTTITLPDKTKVKLPEGIKDTDVDLIIKTKLEIQIIPNKETYEKALEIQEIIKKSKEINNSTSDLLTRLKEKR